jgi:uncharacterized small protein (DUF1192 family)
MGSETPTGTSDGDTLSVDELVALVRRLEQTIAELQVENARLKGQLEDRDGQQLKLTRQVDRLAQLSMKIAEDR